jgi:excinuclease UvrABC ATPase subunit
MVKHLGSSLVDVMYIFDEPSVGLHPRDVHRLNEMLQKLRDKGNTVLVVEHDPDVIKSADHVIDVGPRAGRAGGEMSSRDVRPVAARGHIDCAVLAARVAGQTGRALAARPVADQTRQRQQPAQRERRHPQRRADGDHRRGRLRQKLLIEEVFLRQHPQAVVIDRRRSARRRARIQRSNAGVMDDIRKAFAAANKVDAGLFSFNSKGARANCKGSGVIYTDLAFLDAVKTPWRCARVSAFSRRCWRITSTASRSATCWR